MCGTNDGWCRRNRPEIFFDPLLRHGCIKIAHDRQGEIVRCVVGREEVLHLHKSGRTNMVVASENRMSVGMSWGIEILSEQNAAQPVRLVFDSLATLVLNHRFLIVQSLLGESLPKSGQAVRLRPKCVLQTAGRRRLEEVRLVRSGIRPSLAYREIRAQKIYGQFPLFKSRAVFIRHTVRPC